MAPPEPPALDKPVRLTSLDAYRGFVMLAMASAGFALPAAMKNAEVLARFDGTSYAPQWKAVCGFVGYELEHVPWTGCSFWDLIQPSFMFMVGVALPYSYARRRSLGASTASTIAHVLFRSVILVLLGLFLSSNSSPQTNFTFVNVLTQIGLGYAFVYLLLGRGLGLQLAAIAAILGGYWYLFYQHPLPPTDFDYAAVKIPEDWTFLTGLGAHWNKHTNFAAWFDAEWRDIGFMNLFPRPQPFRFNEGGYQTLNFVPSMVTMILGLIAGELLRGPLSPLVKARRLVLAGALCLALGMAVDGGIWPYFDFKWSLCPIVKRIWTPSWAVFSSGWTFWMLAAFYWVIDIKGWKAWAFPLVVVGMNSIAMYCLSQLLKPWISSTLKIHLGQQIFDGSTGPVLQAAAQLAVLWLICFWMYRQKIFVRI
jgi:predicted acyltransferase